MCDFICFRTQFQNLASISM